MKLRYYVIVLIIIFTQVFTPVYAVSNEDYDYIYGKTNLLLIGANDKYDTPYNFFVVLTIDSINKQLTLTSLQKNIIFKSGESSLYDTYLNNDEEYLKKIIKEYYHINIDNYVVMNKLALKKIVDTTKTIKINNNLVTGNDLLNVLENTRFVDIHTQEQIQRDVIQELLYGFSRLPFSKYPYVIKKCFNYVKVDLSPFKMLCLGFTALSLKNYTALQFQLP